MQKDFLINEMKLLHDKGVVFCSLVTYVHEQILDKFKIISLH